MTRREIHCVECGGKVSARLTDGSEVYPHRPDLSNLPFWKCDTCGNHVGCHHKTKNRTLPLGCIPNQELKAARSHIHRLIDPLWKSGRIKRGALYARMTELIDNGHAFHSASLRSVEEARLAYRAGQQIAKEMDQ